MAVREQTELNKINILKKETLDSLDLSQHVGEIFGTTDDVECNYTQEEKDKLAQLKVEANNFAESERLKSKNLFYPVKVWFPLSTSGLTTTIDENNIFHTQGTSSLVDGLTGWLSSSVTDNDMHLEAGKTYTISVQKISGNDAGGFVRITFHTKNDSWLFDKNMSMNTHETFTPTEDVWLRCAYGAFPFNTAVDCYYAIQIEEGSVATDYQPYNGAIVHEKQLNDKAVTLVDSISLADGYTKIDLSNINFKAGVPYLIEVAGGVPTANDGKIYVNNLTSGYSILTELYNEEAGLVATEQHHNHIPCRFDKLFTIKIFVKSAAYNNGATTFITCENFSVPSNAVGGGKYVRNSRGIANAYPATSIQIQSDSAFWAGTNVKIYKYGE